MKKCKDLEGRSHGLTEVISWHFPEGTEEKGISFDQCILRQYRKSIQESIIPFIYNCLYLLVIL